MKRYMLLVTFLSCVALAMEEEKIFVGVICREQETKECDDTRYEVTIESMALFAALIHQVVNVHPNSDACAQATLKCKINERKMALDWQGDRATVTHKDIAHRILPYIPLVAKPVETMPAKYKVKLGSTPVYIVLDNPEHHGGWQMVKQVRLAPDQILASDAYRPEDLTAMFGGIYGSQQPILLASSRPHIPANWAIQK